MADRTQQILTGVTSGSTWTHTYAATERSTLLAVRAVFDGSAAAGNFKPCVKIISDAGQVMAETIGDTVLVGGSADASFFPRVKRRVTSVVNFTYYQVIAALQVTNTLVAQWHLTDGASPYADTSGFSPGTPDTQTRQVGVTAMTQNLADGPLSTAPAGPSVRFNFDGDSRTSTGDYLLGAGGTAARTGFAGNATFSVVAWIKPTAGAASHPGPVISTVTVTNFGAPNARDDGWMISVQEPSLECKVERWCDVETGQVPDSVSLGAMLTDRWTMIGMSYDGATLRGYADGTLIGSTASAGGIGNAIEASIGQGGGHLGNWIDYYYGRAAEISIWSSVLTDDDFALLYAAAVG